MLFGLCLPGIRVGIGIETPPAYGGNHMLRVDCDNDPDGDAEWFFSRNVLGITALTDGLSAARRGSIRAHRPCQPVDEASIMLSGKAASEARRAAIDRL
jgi:hypothetical protein